MKKIFALLTALCCLFSFAAMAEEINWADIEPTIAASGVEGNFVTFDEISVKIWLPSDLKPVELSDDDKAQGYIGYFQDDNQEATVAVSYVDMNGMSLEDFAAKLGEDSECTEIEMATINSLPALTYRIPSRDVACVDFATEAGYILEIVMNPLSVEGGDVVWGIVAASIQAA